MTGNDTNTKGNAMTLKEIKAPTSSRWTFVGTNGGFLFWRSRNSVLYAQRVQDGGKSLWYRVIK